MLFIIKALELSDYKKYHLPYIFRVHSIIAPYIFSRVQCICPYSYANPYRMIISRLCTEIRLTMQHAQRAKSFITGKKKLKNNIVYV